MKVYKAKVARTCKVCGQWIELGEEYVIAHRMCMHPACLGVYERRRELLKQKGKKWLRGDGGGGRVIRSTRGMGG